VFDELAANRRRSIALIVGFALFIVIVGWAFSTVAGGGVAGLVIAVVFSVSMTALSYWKSDSIALSMSHARPADPDKYARLHNVVEGLCLASGLPKPRLYVVEDRAPNAFATGRNPQHAAVAVTTGLLETMNRVELEAVLAHELGHIKNNDILVATIAVTMVGVAALLSDFGLRFLFWGGPGHRRDRDNDSGGGAAAALAVFGIVLLVVTPLVAKVMQLAISRKRESLADITAVSMTRYPPGLISALEKLRDDKTVVHSASKATAHLWIESPLGNTPETVVNPKEGRFARFNTLFMTHPPLEDRIAALREL
jgi:heat shock protein HtpX